MKERTIRFGEGKDLVGVLSLPAQLDPGRPAILIPNTGINHRAGPNRLHVQTARAFACAGHAVLRMDLAGMGDSRIASGRGADSVADQRAALDEMQRLGLGQRFGVIGLCSGGHDAHRLTAADPRIVAGAYLDHYAYATTKFRVIYWKDRVLDLRRIRNFIRRKWGRSGMSEKEMFRANDLQYFATPPAQIFATDLSAFMSRGVSLFFLFTGDVQNEYNYRAQLTDAFPGLRKYPKLALHHLPLADHTFTSSAMRTELIDLLGKWLRDVSP